MAQFLYIGETSCPPCRMKGIRVACTCPREITVPASDTEWIDASVHKLRNIASVVPHSAAHCVYVEEGWSHVLKLHLPAAWATAMMMVQDIAMWPPGLLSICVAYVVDAAWNMYGV